MSVQRIAGPADGWTFEDRDMAGCWADRPGDLIDRACRQPSDPQSPTGLCPEHHQLLTHRTPDTVT